MAATFEKWKIEESAAPIVKISPLPFITEENQQSYKYNIFTRFQ